jgi:heme-NO-binding protein
VTGVVLTEFVEFAEGRLAIPLPDASFSVPEHYEPATFLALVDRVATQAGLTRRAVLERFGVHLFGRFAALYPAFFVGGSAMDLLRTINTYVHGEVQKLYPGAEFPAFDVREPAAGQLELGYHSSRPLADLADGLIRGCVAHFGTPIRVERHDPPDADGTAARFVLVDATPRRRRG